MRRKKGQLLLKHSDDIRGSNGALQYKFTYSSAYYTGMGLYFHHCNETTSTKGAAPSARTGVNNKWPPWPAKNHRAPPQKDLTCGI
jgi:hypothetical protein